MGQNYEKSGKPHHSDDDGPPKETRDKVFQIVSVKEADENPIYEPENLAVLGCISEVRFDWLPSRLAV